MKTINAITATDMTNKKTMKIVESAPVLPSSKVVLNATGNCATIPVKMINEIPLPIPLCVICSPSHTKKIVPERLR